MSQGKSASLSTATFALGGVATLAYPLVRTTPFGDGWYFAIVLSAILAATIGLHRALPARRLPWMLLIGFMCAQLPAA